MKKTLFAALVALGAGLAVRAVDATGDWDRTIAEFPARDGEADDTARVQRAIDATPSGVLYFPNGTYRISSTLVVTNRCSLRLHKSATLRAVATMPYVIKIHNNKCRFSGDRRYDYNHFVKGGRIDGDGLASCMALDGFWHYTLRDVSFLNGKEFGLRMHSEAGGCEQMAYNLYFITVKSGLAGNTAVYTTGSDSHFTDCVVVDYTIGFRNAGGANRYTRCHVWGGPVPPAKPGEDREMLKDSVNFWAEGHDTILRDCYADTGKTGFRIDGMVHFFGCRYFNNRHFKLDGITVFDHRKGTALISGCHFMSGGTPDIRLYCGAPGTAGKAVWRDCQCTGAFKDADEIPGLMDFEVDQDVATADEWNFVPEKYVFSSPVGEYRTKACTGFDFRVSRKRMNRRFPKAGPGTALVIRARATTPETKRIEIALKHMTDKVWGTQLPLATDWQDIRVPLSELRYFSHWGGVPPLEKGDAPDARLVSEIKFCFGKWICPDTLDAAHGVEIESVRIVGR